MLTSPSSSRSASLARILVLGLVLTVLSQGAAFAQEPPASTQGDATQGQLVRLVETAGGGLVVLRGDTLARIDGRIVAAEQDVVLHTTLISPEVLTSSGIVDDTLRAEQWGLDEVGAEKLWATADGAGQVIAIVDSGIDGRHRDFRRRLVTGFSATGGDPTVDGHGHGTHVAGTAGAATADGYGIAGLAPAASIMPIQVTDAEGRAYGSDVAEGLIWAVDNGATVANLSLAGTTRSVVLDVAIDYAVARGVVVVVAAGNEHERGNPATYPASHPSVLAVGAMRDAGTRSSFSTTGSFVDIMAPGTSVLSDRPGGEFGFASGTSMAAPLVAGAVALLRSASPDLDPTAIGDLLAETARDLGRRGRDDDFGHGFLDVAAALATIAPAGAADDAPTPVAPTGRFGADLDDASWVNPNW